MIRIARLFLVLAALFAATSAHAQTPSPRRGSFELGVGNYTPSIDDGFASPGPYEKMFGSGRGWLFRFGISRALYRGYGTLEGGFQSGFFRRSASAFVVGSNPPVRSADTTALNIIPTSLTLTYRYDNLVDGNPQIPIAPYVRATLERYNWWVTDQHGMAQKGATNGYSFTGGLAIALDFFDPGRGREMDTEVGINHTYLYFDVTKSFVDDFGSSKSWNMSGNELMLSAGLMFVF